MDVRSAANSSRYVRGSHQDYDDWASLTGDKSWGSKSMAHYMRKHQTLEPFTNDAKQRATMPTVDEFHGTDGELCCFFNARIWVLWGAPGLLFVWP